MAKVVTWTTHHTVRNCRNYCPYLLREGGAPDRCDLSVNPDRDGLQLAQENSKTLVTCPLLKDGSLTIEEEVPDAP